MTGKFPEAWKQGIINAKLPRRPSKLQAVMTNFMSGEISKETAVDVAMSVAKKQELYVGKKT